MSAFIVIFFLSTEIRSEQSTIDSFARSISTMTSTQDEHCPHCLDDDNFADCNIPGLNPIAKRNCRRLLTSNDVPIDAFRYALFTLKKNAQKFSSNKCYQVADKWHYSMKNKSKAEIEGSMMNGFPNKCQMMINDTRAKVPEGYPFRRKAFYIDLCQTSGPKVIQTYFNLGTGTLRNNYSNQASKRSTVLGPFFTHTQTFNYQPTNKKYQSVRSKVRRLSGVSESTAVQLFGMASTNSNSAAHLKYMHVSPYKSSWGCPSYAAENYWMIKQLADNGPSLVLNYGDSLNGDELDRCSND